MGDMHFLFGDFHLSRILYILIHETRLESTFEFGKSEIGHILHKKNGIKVALYSGFYHLNEVMKCTFVPFKSNQQLYLRFLEVWNSLFMKASRDNLNKI